ncbi:hypothetical protein [Thalassovita sp.]|uniref:hypothetical protein n=1 Tax=Thalassovita sp. TaxID=1979401 RepID=UPI002B265F87|nr:hypothetical protein [Thalassovita sp.]
MTSVKHAPKSAKTYVDAAQKGAAKLAGWSKAAQKLEKEGKTLDEVDAVLSKLAFMAKISTTLQVVSMGLSVLGLFLPATKSKEDKIYDAIEDISAHLDRLDTEVHGLIAAIKDSTSRGVLETNISHINTAYGYMASIAAKKKKGEDYSQDLTDLATVDLVQLKTAVGVIRDYVTGTPLAPNLLQLVFTESYGHIQTMTILADFLNHKAELAIGAAAAAAAAKKEVAGITLSDADKIKIAENIEGDATIPSDYAGLLKTISAACHKWVRSCAVQSDYRGQIDRYLRDKVLTDKSLDKTDHQGNAEMIVKALSANWTWINFTAISYDPISSFEKHGCVSHGKGNRMLTYFREPAANGDKVNLVIYFAPRTKAKTGSWDIAGAEAETNTYRRLAIQSVDITLNSHKRVGFTYWNETHADDVRDYFHYYSGIAHASTPKDWHGDMLWTGWNNGDQIEELGGSDQFFGICSHNPALLKRGRIEFDRGGNLFHYLTGYYALAVWDDAS